jgi:hypothetical protein
MIINFEQLREIHEIFFSYTHFCRPCKDAARGGPPLDRYNYGTGLDSLAD